MLIDPKQWPTISRLLDAVLDVPPEERDRWLDSLPPADAEYREELRTLLRQGAAAETRDFLDVLPDLHETVAEARAAAGVVPITAGMSVGPYVVEAELGSGGMGTVWLARRSDGVIKRPVALKLPHAGPYGRLLAERFASERNILAELSHPNIARLYDAGFSADGQPYLALEYVAGAPLTQYCDERRLNITQRLELFQQVLRAVQHAHANLVIHRDLKPSNVIVGNDGRAMLLDFGIARLVALDAPEPGARAQPAAAGLTPDYASPEQIAGHAVTTATDIYSLGVLLFELLCGERPHRLALDSHATLEEAILSGAPLRPSESVRSDAAAAARASSTLGLSRLLSGDLDAIVLKAMQKDPAQRYSATNAFLEDIERYLAGEPVAARAGGGWYRARKFVTRHRVSAVGGAAALIAIIATAAIAMFEAHNSAVHARAAAAERDRAVVLSMRSEALVQFLEDLIAEGSATDKRLTIGDLLARSESLAEAEAGSDQEQRAAVLDMLGNYYHTTGNDSRSEPMLRDALYALKDSKDDDLRRKVTCDYALSLAGMGKLAEASQLLQDVIADPRATTQQSADCLEDLAFVAQDRGDAVGALKYGQLALDRLNRLEHPAATRRGTFLGSIGFAEYLNGRNSAAQIYYRQALAQFELAGRLRGTEAVAVRNNLAIVSDGAGDPRHGLALHEENLRIVTENDPNISPPLYLVANRARDLQAMGRYAQAREAYLQCVELCEKMGNPANRVFCLGGLALTAYELGDLAQADHWLALADAVSAEHVPAGSPPSVMLHTLRGRMAFTRGRFAEARSNLDTAVAEAKGFAPAMIGPLISRAELNLAQSQADAARADAENALRLARAAQGDIAYSNRTGEAWLVLGRVLEQLQDAPAAHQAYQAAVVNLSNTVDPDHPKLLQARRLAGE